MNTGVMERFHAVGLEEILRKTLIQPRQALVPLVNVLRSDPSYVQPNFLSPMPVEEKDFGDFYERMVQGWYGGERHVSQAMHFGGKAYFASYKPDLVSDDFIYEQKSLGPTTTLVLRDKQMFMYLMQQAVNPGKRVAHQFFRHGVKDVTKNEKVYTEKHLARDLALNTLYALDLDVSVSYAMWSIKRPGEINDRFDYLLQNPETSEKFTEKQIRKRLNADHYTGVKASTLHCFLYAPKLMLRALGLNPKWYRVSRHLSPDKMVIDGQRVRQFPVVSVHLKHPSAWLHYLYSSIQPQNDLPEDFSDSDVAILDSIKDARREYRKLKVADSPKVNGYQSRIAKYPDIPDVLRPQKDYIDVQASSEKIPF